jgi:flagellar hook-basal body complex protein FliE
MKQLTNISLGAVALALLLSASACGKSEQKTEGPAEKAGATLGKAIDQATEKAGEAMTKAGEAMKETVQKAKESVSEAVDKMKEDKK